MILKNSINTQEFIDICYFLRYKVDYYNSESKFDINKDLEKIGIILFKYLYKYELKDMNIKKKNHPAIDLGELTKFIGIQVTSTDTTSKISNTIDMFFKHKLHEEFVNGLKIFIFSFDEDTNLKNHASKRVNTHLSNDKKAITGEDFVEIVFLTTMINKFSKMDSLHQYDCLMEMKKEIVTPLINRLKPDEDLIIHQAVNGKKLEEYYDDNSDILADLEAIQSKLSSLSFETRMLLFDLINLAEESENDEIDLYLLKDIGLKIHAAGLSGNLDQLVLHKFVKLNEELYIKDSDVPIEVAILKMPIKNKNRYFGWATLRKIYLNLLSPDEVFKMVQFLDFRVFDN